MTVIASADLGNAIAGGVGSRVRVTKSDSQSIDLNSTEVVTWNTEQFDTDGWFTAGGSVFTVPTGQAGLYSIDAGVILNTLPGNASYGINIEINGTTIMGTGTSATNSAALSTAPNTPKLSCSLTVELLATNTIELTGQTLTNTITIDYAEITIVRIGPTV